MTHGRWRARAKAAVGGVVAMAILPVMVLTAAPASADLPNGYVLVDLLTSPAVTTSEAFGIDEGSGVAVGQLTVEGTQHGFVSMGGTSWELNDPKGLSGTSAAYAVHGSWVAGDSLVQPATGPAVPQAYRFSGPFTYEPLGSPVAGTASHAAAVDANGTVVGWAATGAAGSHQPFLSMNGSSELLFGAGSTVIGEATDLNSAGQVVGWMAGLGGSTVPFLTTLAQRAPTPIAGLADKANAQVTAINDAGVVVGTYEKPSPLPGPEGAVIVVGFRYDTVTGAFSELSYFGGPAAPTDVNDSGVAVANGFIDAFVWDPIEGAAPVESLVVNDEGWNIISLAGINDAGQIVGTAIHDGVQRAVRLDPVSTIAQLTTSTTVSPATPTVGAPATYTFSVQNSGTGPAYGTTLEIWLLQFTAGTTGTLGTLPAGCTGQQNGAQYHVVCSLGLVNAGQTVTRPLSVTYATSGTHQVSSNVWSYSPETSTDDNSTMHTAEVANVPPLLAPLLPTIQLVQKTVSALAKLLLPRPPTTPA